MTSGIEKDLKVFPQVKYKESTFVPWPGMEEDPEKKLKLFKDFDSRKSDIFLCTAPKSGTHWTHEMIYMLSRQTPEYCPRPLFSVHMDRMADFEALEHHSEPRILHSHLPFSFLPTKHIDNGGKTVFVNRNPKDRHVSLYHFFLGKVGVPDNYSWQNYFDEMVLNDTFNTGWFNYTKEFIEAIENKSANILHLMYEDIQLNPVEQITRLAKFLEVPRDPAFIQSVVDKCSFNKLKANITLPGNTKGEKSTVFRRGIIGDWRNWFTVSQNEQFDEIYLQEMKGTHIGYTYG